MKVCSVCNQTKSLVEFSWKNKSQNRKASECKSCHRLLRKNYYLKNAEKEKTRIRDRKDRINRWFRRLKSNLKCNRCGFSHPATLQFHHTDPEQKDIEVSTMVKNSLSIENIKKEISKCEVLCANCHFIHHYDEQKQKGVIV